MLKPKLVLFWTFPGSTALLFGPVLGRFCSGSGPKQAPALLIRSRTCEPDPNGSSVSVCCRFFCCVSPWKRFILRLILSSCPRCSENKNSDDVFLPSYCGRTSFQNRQTGSEQTEAGFCSLTDYPASNFCQKLKNIFKLRNFKIFLENFR